MKATVLVLMIAVAPVTFVASAGGAAAPTGPFEEAGRLVDQLAGRLGTFGADLVQQIQQGRGGLDMPGRTDGGPRASGLSSPSCSITGPSSDSLRSRSTRLETIRGEFAREAIRLGAYIRIAELDLGTLLDQDPVDLAKAEAKTRPVRWRSSAPTSGSRDSARSSRGRPCSPGSNSGRASRRCWSGGMHHGTPGNARAPALRRHRHPALAGCGKTKDRSMRHASLKSNQEVGMRGDESIPDDMFSYVRPEQRVPADHPLRPIRTLVDEVLRDLSPRFARLYAKTGRPSIPPEKLLRALLLQTLYSIRSERQLMEQLDFNILYRWFVGLSLDAPVWDVTVFTKNRERLLAGDIAQAFFAAVVKQAQARQLLSPEHFTVDGTLIEAWAGLKSFTRRDAGPRRPMIPAIPRWTSMASGARTPPMSRRPIPRRG